MLCARAIHLQSLAVIVVHRTSRPYSARAISRVRNFNSFPPSPVPLPALPLMAPLATLEYASNAPEPLSPDSPDSPSYPRLPKHYLLPSNTPDYLRLILNAKVYDILKETPLVLATNLSTKLGNEIYLKREDLQEVFSFKIRGAYNFMASLSDDERWKGVVTCSAGQCA